MNMTTLFAIAAKGIRMLPIVLLTMTILNIDEYKVEAEDTRMRIDMKMRT